MYLFFDLAESLLHVVGNPEKGNDFNFLRDKNYTFTYRRNYTGLMAKINPKFKKYARCKQGLFDVRGKMGNVSLTHHQLFTEILNNCTLSECYTVWRGEMPSNLSPEKKNPLMSLAMLMFEQEINFGNEDFQRKTHFSPNYISPRYKRPRDLLMGYIFYMFNQGNTECLRRFENSKGLLLPPNDEVIKELYFDSLINDEKASALMANKDIREAFIEAGKNLPHNPNK